MYHCEYTVVKTQSSLFVHDFLKSKMENKVTALSSVSIRQFTCLICKEKNLSTKSLLRLRLLQSLMMKRMVAQVQMCIFDHISKKGYVWSAEVVICQKLTHGTINQAVLKAVQRQGKKYSSFSKAEAAYLKKKKELLLWSLWDPLALCSLHMFSAYHQYIT